MKTCRGCGQDKPLDGFPSNKSSPDGRHSRCKACRSEKMKAWRGKPEVKGAEAIRVRKQYESGRDAILARRKERYEANKEFELARNRKWSDKNREYHRAINRQWSKDNPEASRAIVARRRARIVGADGSYSKHDVKALMIEQGGVCTACRCDLSESGYHIDHMMPLSKGGANDKSNLQLLCPTCNRRKGAKLPDAWKQEIHR